MEGNSDRDVGEMQTLSDQAVRLWDLHAIIRVALLAVVAAIGGGIAWKSGAWPWYAPLLFLVLVLGLLPPLALWFNRALHRGWRYSLADSIVRLRYGVIVRREVDVPLSRVQHVDVEEGPLERHFGLARLILFTAGTQGASQVIPGLPTDLARQLRDRLLEERELLFPSRSDD